jgi:ABC-type transporter Mla MlaB component
MTVDRSKSQDRSAKERRALSTAPQAKPSQADPSPEQRCIEVGSSGDWMPAEELWKAALAASGEGRDAAVNLGEIDHLDASALQILLALDAEQKKRGQKLELANASEHLRQWFAYAGVADQFFMSGTKSDE